MITDRYNEVIKGEVMHAFLYFMLAVCVSKPVFAETPLDYPVQPVPFSAVHVTGGFWTPRLETNRTVTIPYDFKKCEETGRISNFEVAGGLKEGEFQGLRFNDSDVFKIVEGAAYSLSIHPDPALDHYLDDLIAKFAAAQEDDGYLYTTRTINPGNPVNASKGRWSNLRVDHELYNVGHMYEAAVAHYVATGKRSFLDVALKNADLIARVFGPGDDQLHGVPGHEEIEIGLARLYRVTGERKYLDLAKYFLDQRGNRPEKELYGEYAQDHIPVVRQDAPVGHAVRAAYLYSGMADVAALTGDAEYIAALGRIWENTVNRKLYITGGIGSSHSGERFGDDYELPNATAYNETCASIANMLWNHRMFLLHGDGKYMDVFERTLYNAFLAGVSFGGDTFFYPNPLESDGIYKFNIGQSATRSPWFDCSCCPSNVVRFMPSIPGYAYAVRESEVYVNLYINSRTGIEVNCRSLSIEQTSDYPWDGTVTVTLAPERASEFTLRLRIPGWVRNKPVPGDLYSFLDHSDEMPIVAVNGTDTPIKFDSGYAVITRKWRKGDTVTLTLPMPVRRIFANQKVDADRGRIAIQRGPLIYCAEWVDNNGGVTNLILPDGASLSSEFRPGLLNGVTVVTGTVPVFVPSDGGASVVTESREFTAIPYYAWSHRGTGEMAVWLPRKAGAVKVAPGE